MKTFTAVVVILLAGCSDDPLPERCRQLGIDVLPTDEITGTIIEEHEADLYTVRTRCQDILTQEKYGCAIATNVGEYVLWYVADPNVRDHERCHALYEKGHIEK